MSDPLLVGVDVGGTKLLLVAVGGGVRETHRAETGPGAGPPEVEREVARFVRRLPRAPDALGLAVPGLVDEDAGRVAACDVLPRLAGWEAGAALRRLSPHVRVMNDAGAALVEEAHDLAPGATAGIVMAGTAVGAAFRVHGVPLRGARGWAGEIGYLPLSVDGRVRTLDDLAGGAATAARLGISGAGLAARAAAGDPATLAAVREAGTALGLGLAAVVNLLNPELLAVGGGAAALPGYFEAAVESAAAHALPELWRACTVRRARAGEAVVALGAARAAADLGDSGSVGEDM